MSFTADKQTLEDLNLLGKYKPNSIFSLFNQLKTRGGERLLQDRFQHPLTDPQAINERSQLFSHFQQQKLKFPFQKGSFDLMESYLSMGTSTNYLSAMVAFGYKKILDVFLRDEHYQLTLQGLLATLSILKTYRDFLDKQKDEQVNAYSLEKKAIQNIFSDPRLRFISIETDENKLSLLKAARYDFLLKNTFQREMELILESLYRLDLYTAVAEVGGNNGFEYARAHPNTAGIFKTTALRHPGLPKGIANPLSLNQDENMVFLTGANMAGKSTFMKSFGIAVYLAHMGFPVAAKAMEFSVCDGLYSSINVSDDLNMGYSHFYAEVLRVKTVALEVSQGKNLVVLFDELFKGTNVKDAYDGTFSVTEAFSKYRNCFFMVSTHIIEVGEALKNGNPNIRFAYLPTVMDGQVPRYTYQLTSGITSDRHGMMIIQNEGILDLINETEIK